MKANSFSIERWIVVDKKLGRRAWRSFSPLIKEWFVGLQDFFDKSETSLNQERAGDEDQGLPLIVQSI